MRAKLYTADLCPPCCALCFESHAVSKQASENEGRIAASTSCGRFPGFAKVSIKEAKIQWQGVWRRLLRLPTRRSSRTNWRDRSHAKTLLDGRNLHSVVLYGSFTKLSVCTVNCQPISIYGSSWGGSPLPLPPSPPPTASGPGCAQWQAPRCIESGASQVRWKQEVPD